MSSWCDVIYRRFDFGSFPPHVRQLHTYAWKPIAIAVSTNLSCHHRQLGLGGMNFDSVSIRDLLEITDDESHGTIRVFFR